MTVHFVLGALLLGVLQFLFVATGAGLWLSPAVGGMGVLYWRLVDPNERGRPGLVRTLGSVTAGAVPGTAVALLLAADQSPLHALAALAGALAAAAALSQMGSQRPSGTCVLCKRPAAEAAGFDCPRCADRVCARPTCWNPRYSRCVRCHEREIVVFPIADKWWTARLGPRLGQGECTSCGKEARETDLRECGQCHWPMCRRCWDHYNGSCRRCEWVLPDVPARLRPFIRSGRARPGSGAPIPAARSEDSMRPRRS